MTAPPVGEAPATHAADKTKADPKASRDEAKANCFQKYKQLIKIDSMDSCYQAAEPYINRDMDANSQDTIYLSTGWYRAGMETAWKKQSKFWFHYSFFDVFLIFFSRKRMDTLGGSDWIQYICVSAALPGKTWQKWWIWDLITDRPQGTVVHRVIQGWHGNSVKKAIKVLVSLQFVWYFLV